MIASKSKAYPKDAKNYTIAELFLTFTQTPFFGFWTHVAISCVMLETRKSTTKFIQLKSILSIDSPFHGLDIVLLQQPFPSSFCYEDLHCCRWQTGHLGGWACLCWGSVFVVWYAGRRMWTCGGDHALMCDRDRITRHDRLQTTLVEGMRCLTSLSHALWSRSM